MKFKYNRKIAGITNSMNLMQIKPYRFYEIEPVTVVGNFCGEKVANQIRTDDVYATLLFDGESISTSQIWCDLAYLYAGNGLRNTKTGDIKVVQVVTERIR